jgi:ribosomal-protein-alanine N-acetyltransferase
MLDMPVLETERLLIRPFVMDDLADAQRLFDVELQDASLHTDKPDTLGERREWLQWAALNPAQLAKLNQPPYGDRAVILKSSGQLIGSCGFVPCLAPFEQLPGFGASGEPENHGKWSPEFGLFYAISPSYRRRGYATEAAQALVEYAFRELHLKRIVATTDNDNAGSMGVMSRLGMCIEKNPLPEPEWLQVVGVLENAA